MIVSTHFDINRLVRSLGRPLLFIVGYAAVVTLLWERGSAWVSVQDLPLSLLGTAIALIVTFRNNAAYDRWWEARGLWGQIVNNARSFARGLQLFLADPVQRARLVHLQIAHVVALRSALLAQQPWDDLAPHVPPAAMPRLRGCANVANAIHTLIADELGALRRSGALDSIGAASIDATLTALANAQGGLERIKRTPMPRQYDQFPRIFVALYCALLPIGLVHDLGWFTMFSAPIIGIMFVSLDRIGRDLENPFTGTLHDVPMRAIVRTIEIDLLQTIEAPAVPEPVTPVDGVLW